MPFILDNNKSIRYQEGLKAGLEKGLEKGLAKGLKKSTEKIERVAKSLLLTNNYSIEEIATLLDIPKESVQKIKNVKISGNRD